MARFLLLGVFNIFNIIYIFTLEPLNFHKNKFNISAAKLLNTVKIVSRGTGKYNVSRGTSYVKSY